jgi:hypothetical protein
VVRKTDNLTTMKQKILKSLLIQGIAGVLVFGCAKDNLTSTSNLSSSALTAGSTKESALVAVAQTSSQLASGTTFSIQTTPTGSPIDTTHTPPQPGHCKNGGMGSFLNGTDFLTPTNQLLAIVDAESAGDMRGLQMFGHSGATITNYNAQGDVVALPLPPSGGPQGVSFSGGQFPVIDSVLKTIVKTIVDFGSGVSVAHDSTTITRVGQIVITRSVSGHVITETITFQNYSVNNNSIQGTKTRINTYDPKSGIGSSSTVVSNGKITFNDGTVSAWVSSHQRNSNIVMDTVHHHPLSGTVVTTTATTVTGSDGIVIYSHDTTNPVTVNISCGPNRPWPVSGTIETDYGAQKVIIDFGNGTCSNRTISITINGVTTTKTIG